MRHMYYLPQRLSRCCCQLLSPVRIESIRKFYLKLKLKCANVMKILIFSNKNFVTRLTPLAKVSPYRNRIRHDQTDPQGHTSSHLSTEFRPGHRTIRGLSESWSPTGHRRKPAEKFLFVFEKHDINHNLSCEPKLFSATQCGPCLKMNSNDSMQLTSKCTEKLNETWVEFNNINGSYPMDFLRYF